MTITKWNFKPAAKNRTGEAKEREAFEAFWETSSFEKFKDTGYACWLARAALVARCAATPAILCACKDRLASECEEEWGPKCDLGNNPKHAYAGAPSAAPAGTAKAIAQQAEPDKSSTEDDRCGPISAEGELRFRHEHDLHNTPGYAGSLLCRRAEAALSSQQPSPAPQVLPTMEDAIAAGDGTLHGAIDYWHARALAAEAGAELTDHQCAAQLAKMQPPPMNDWAAMHDWAMSALRVGYRLALTQAKQEK